MEKGVCTILSCLARWVRGGWVWWRSWLFHLGMFRWFNVQESVTDATRRWSECGEVGRGKESKS